MNTSTTNLSTLPLDVLLGKPPKMHRNVESATTAGTEFDLSKVELNDAAERLIAPSNNC